MATNLKLDEALLEQAFRLSKKKTKKAAVMEALSEYVRRRMQGDLLKLFGTIEFDRSFDYKSERTRS